MTDLPALLMLLAEKVEACRETSNSLDVQIDVALFKPDSRYASAKPNAAGTKVVHTRHDGKTETFWSTDHTMDAIGRQLAAARLRSLIQEHKDGTP